MWDSFRTINRALWHEVLVLIIGLTFGCPLAVFAGRLLMPMYFNGYTSQVSWWKEDAPFIALAGFIVGTLYSVVLMRQKRNNR